MDREPQSLLPSQCLPHLPTLARTHLWDMFSSILKSLPPPHYYDDDICPTPPPLSLLFNLTPLSSQRLCYLPVYCLCLIYSLLFLHLVLSLLFNPRTSSLSSFMLQVIHTLGPSLSPFFLFFVCLYCYLIFPHFFFLFVYATCDAYPWLSSTSSFSSSL